MRLKNALCGAKKLIALVLVFGLTFAGIISIHAEEEKSKTIYQIDASPLQWKYDGTELWRDDRIGDGYVGVWNETRFVPGADYAVAVTFTAPEDVTLHPSSVDRSIVAYRDFKVADYANTDGARIAVFLNNTKIYPTDSDWETISDDGYKPTTIKLPAISMKKGDKLRYVIDNGGNGNNKYDNVMLSAEAHYVQGTDYDIPYVNFSQVLSYTDTASGNANSGIGNYTKAELVTFESVSIKKSQIITEVEPNTAKVNLSAEPLSWSVLNGAYFWCGATTPNDMFLNYDHNYNGDYLTPGTTSSVAIAFTAPCNGRIDNSFGLGSFYRAVNANEPNDGSTDGARLTVVSNNTVLFPQTGIWADAPQEGTEGFEPMNITFNSMNMKKGDTIYYIVDNGGNGNNSYDLVNLIGVGFMWIDENNPDGVWVGIRDNFYNATSANDESSIPGYSKKAILSYLFTSVEEIVPVGDAENITVKDVDPIANDLFVPMVWNANSGEKGEFRIEGDDYIIMSEDYAQPSEKYMLAVKWTAEEDGRVDISKSYVWNWLFNNEQALSDGVRYKVLLNGNKQIYPSAADTEWINTNGTEKSFIDLKPFAVEKGDEIMIIVDCKEQVSYDTMTVQFIIDFAEVGESYTKTYNNIKSMYDKNSAFTYYGIKLDKSSVNDTPTGGGNTGDDNTGDGTTGGGNTGSDIPSKGDTMVMIMVGLLLMSFGIAFVVISNKKKEGKNYV